MSVDHPTSSNDTHEEHATTDQLARVEAALLTLPRFTRAVFVAHRFGNLSYTEIATRSGVSTRRVEREMARAIYGLHCAMQGRPSRRSWWTRW